MSESARYAVPRETAHDQRGGERDDLIADPANLASVDERRSSYEMDQNLDTTADIDQNDHVEHHYQGDDHNDHLDDDLVENVDEIADGTDRGSEGPDTGEGHIEGIYLEGINLIAPPDDPANQPIEESDDPSPMFSPVLDMLARRAREFRPPPGTAKV